MKVVGVIGVLASGSDETFLFFKGYFPNHFAGDTDDQGIIGNVTSRGNHCARSDQAVVTNFHIFEEYGTHSDEGLGTDVDTMNDCPVTDGDVVTDGQWFTGVCMDHAQVLNIDSFSHRNPGVVPSQDSAVPYAAVISEVNVADDGCAPGVVPVFVAVETLTDAEIRREIVRRTIVVDVGHIFALLMRFGFKVQPQRPFRSV